MFAEVEDGKGSIAEIAAASETYGGAHDHEKSTAAQKRSDREYVQREVAAKTDSVPGYN